MKVICQICGEVVAETDMARLSYPLRGGMFSSPDPVHGFPDPFESGLDWEFMRCPYGRTHRPFSLDNVIQTDQGMITLPRGNNAAPSLSEIQTPMNRQEIGDHTTLATVSDELAGDLVRSGMTVFDLGNNPEEDPDISDEDAEALVRAAMAKNQPVMMGGKPNLDVVPETVKLHTCPECGKVYSDFNKYRGHMGAHARYDKGAADAGGI